MNWPGQRKRLVATLLRDRALVGNEPVTATRSSGWRLIFIALSLPLSVSLPISPSLSPFIVVVPEPQHRAHKFAPVRQPLQSAQLPDGGWSRVSIPVLTRYMSIRVNDALLHCLRRGEECPIWCVVLYHQLLPQWDVPIPERKGVDGVLQEEALIDEDTKSCFLALEQTKLGTDS